MGNDITRLSPDDLKGIEVSRCYKAKVMADKESDVYKALLLTHQRFNQLVAQVMQSIRRVLSDKSNPEFARLTEWAILNITPAAQCASHFGNPFCLETSNANPTHHAYNKKPEMKELFLLCKERGDRWFNREAVFGDLIRGGGSGLVMEVNQTAIEKIKSHLELKRLWREGDYEPFGLMERENFLKESRKLLKDNRELFLQETDGPYAPLQELLNLKPKELEGQLRHIHQFQLENSDKLNALQKAQEELSQKRIGKQGWLIQKKHFEKERPEFLRIYSELLADYQKEFEKNGRTAAPFRLPQRWVRDPNFLRVVDRFARWGDDFASPFTNQQAIEAWKTYQDKEKNLPNLDEPGQVLAHRIGRKFYVEQLKALNPVLFRKNGWFWLWENEYSRFEGKRYREFKRPPALRLPDPEFHPEWINFSKEGNFQYRRFEITGPAKAKISVKLISPVTGAWQDYAMDIRLDSRLKSLGPKQCFQIPDGSWSKGWGDFKWKEDKDGNPKYKEAELHYWTDPEDGVTRRIAIHGGNLVYSPHQKSSPIDCEKNSIGGNNTGNSRRQRNFYLYFRYTYTAEPRRKLTELGEFNVLGFDLGHKADAIITIVNNQNGELVKFQPFEFKQHKPAGGGIVAYQLLRVPGGAGIRALTHSERARANLRGKLKQRHTNQNAFRNQGEKSSKAFSRNQETFRRLNNYLLNCREQHYKKLAGAIYKLAQENHCKVIVHENLESYRMSARQERQENKRLNLWAAQKTFDFLESLCESGDIHCFSVGAAYSSQICNRCGHFGVRFNFPTKQEWKNRFKYRKDAMPERPEPFIAPGGDWFLCSNAGCMGKKEPNNPETRYMINADANAARNIALRGAKLGHPFPEISREERERLRDELEKWLKEKYTSKSTIPV